MLSTSIQLSDIAKTQNHYLNPKFWFAIQTVCNSLHIDRKNTKQYESIIAIFEEWMKEKKSMTLDAFASLIAEGVKSTGLDIYNQDTMKNFIHAILENFSKQGACKIPTRYIVENSLGFQRLNSFEENDSYVIDLAFNRFRKNSTWNYISTQT